MFSERFNYITSFTIFTMFHSISQNILRNCFVKYCPLISSKWQHCRNFDLLPAISAERIPTATMLTAASLSQYEQIAYTLKVNL